MVIEDKKIGTIPDNKILLNEIVHVCIVVRNVEKTAKTLVEKYGIGPFEIRQKTYPKSNASVRGEPVEYTLKFGYSKVGSIILELVETIKGKTIYNEFLETHGEGIHHIGFPTRARATGTSVSPISERLMSSFLFNISRFLLRYSLNFTSA